MIENPTLYVLQEARKTIAEKGWIQGKFHGDNGEFCLSGAINRVLPMDIDLSDIHYEQRIHDVIGTRNFVRWNDNPSRTKEEVLEMLDKAIELEKVHVHG